MMLLVGSASAAFLDETNTRLPAALSDQSYTLAIGDVDGVNGPDMLVSNNGQSRLLINNGAGIFTDETGIRIPALSTATIAAKFINVDGDGDLDLFLVNVSGPNVLLINDGDGNFTDQSSSRLPPDTGVGAGADVGDIDGGGSFDIVVAQRDGQNQVLINDGAGFFSDETSSRLPTNASPSHDVVLVDVNGNGALDLFVVNHEAQNRLYINNALGVFAEAPAVNLPMLSDGGLRATAADVDGDGDQDIIVAAGADGVKLLVNNAGVFTAGALPTAPEFTINVAVADIDFDGTLDIAVANAGQDRILLNDGVGTFTDATGAMVPVDDRRSFGNVLFDAEGDFDFDLVVAAPDGQNRFYNNDIQVPRVRVSIAPAFIEELDPVTVIVESFDENGIASTEVTVNGPGAVDVVVPLTGGVGVFNPPEDGAFTIAVVVTDNDSNVTTRSVSFTALEKDLTAPNVTLSISNAAPLIGQTVELDVVAVDPSAGVISSGIASVSLTINGSNVPLDSSGHASVVTSVIGLHNVVAHSTDNSGNTGSDAGSYTVLVDDVQPVIATLTALPDPVDITNPVTINVTATDNVLVSSLTVTVTERDPDGAGPDPAIPIGDGVALNGSGEGSYTPFLPGTYTVEAVALDPSGNSITGTTTFAATGDPDVTPPVVGISITPPNVAIGDPVTITVTATDDIHVQSVALTINGTPVALAPDNTVVFTPPVIGPYTADVSVLDPTGNEGTASAGFQAVDPATDTTPPTVEITSPAPIAELTGQAVITGTADDLLLIQYALEIAEIGNTGSTGPYTTVETGVSPVINGPLGTIDTTVLLNGLYRVRLRAEDVNGHISFVTRDYAVAGNAKLGHYATAITDMRVALSGVNITIKRKYDSRRRGSSLDFGHGWNIEVEKAGTYKNNQVVGTNWGVNIASGPFSPPSCHSANETLPHVTEIRFSDANFYRFVPVISLGALLGGGFCEGTVSYQQVGGVPGATLEQFGSTFVLCGQGNCLNADFTPYNPLDVRLTTLDGREYDLNLNTGLNRIGDANGNSISIGSGGVVHSSGKSILFARDGAGRITTITDPMGQAITYAYDGAGDLVTVDDRVGDITQYVYDTNHFLTQTIDPEGNTQRTNEYDADGRLVGFVDAAGNRTEIATNTETNTTQVTDREGVVRIFQYDANGNIQGATVDGESAIFTTDDRGNRLTSTNPLGNTQTFEYDANNNMTKIINALGNESLFAWNAQSKPTSFTDDNGKVTTFAYDADGNVTEIKDANGNITQSFGYDSSGNVTQVASLAGTANFEYDAFGNRTRMQMVGGPDITSTYDANGNTLSATLKRTVGGAVVNEAITSTYNSNGKVLSETGPLGNVKAYTYNGNGQVNSVTDKRGNTTAFAYNARGLLTQKTMPDGTFEAYGYDAERRLTAVTDRGGRTIFFEYDALGHLEKTIFPDGTSTTRTNRSDGNAIAETDQLGHVTTFEFDNNGRRTKIIDALGNQTVFAYTNTGAASSITDPLGNTKQFQYDEANFGVPRLTKTTFPDTKFRMQSYDLVTGKLASRTNEAGNTTAFTYDGLGRLSTVTNAAGEVTSYTYDEVGNLVSQVDARLNATTFEYDALRHMTKRTLPEGMFETKAYDENGNLTSHTDFNGDTTTYVFDVMNRMTLKTLPGPAVVTYSYTDNDLPATVTDSRGVTTYIYDLLDRLTNINNPDGSSVQYTYDAYGNRKSVTGPAGTVAYTYDARNLVATVTDPESGVYTYTHDVAQRVIQIDFPNALEAHFSYDGNNRLTEVKYTGPSASPTVESYTYTLSPTGNRTRMLEASGRDVHYTYDALERLVTEIDSLTGITSTYSYDAVSNRTSLANEISGVTTTTNYAYDDNDRLLTAGSETYTYDNNGNPLTRTDGAGDPAFSWDARGRLVQQVLSGGSTATFDYDDFGNVVSRDVDGTVTRFVTDPIDASGVPQIVADLNGVGAVQHSQVFGNGLLRLRSGAGVNAFVHPDALGSTRFLSDDGGTVTDIYDYDAFGNSVASSGATINPYQFAGERLEQNMGLYYLRDRYMDPFVGRFVSKDRFPGFRSDPTSLHKYIYAQDNPVNRVDPTGMFFSIGSISVSMAITTTLATMADYGIWKAFVEPVKKAWDKVKKLAKKVNTLNLNTAAKAEELGITAKSVKDGVDGVVKESKKDPTKLKGLFDLTKYVSLGKGMVDESFAIPETMVDTGGKATMVYWELWGAYWLASLPRVDDKPGNYLNCGFNAAVQSTYGLGPVVGASGIGATLLSPGGAVLGFYLGYANFLMLMATTVDDWAAGGVPPQPAAGHCGLPLSGD